MSGQVKRRRMGSWKNLLSVSRLCERGGAYDNLAKTNAVRRDGGRTTDCEGAHFHALLLEKRRRRLLSLLMSMPLIFFLLFLSLSPHLHLGTHWSYSLGLSWAAGGVGSVYVLQNGRGRKELWASVPHSLWARSKDARADSMPPWIPFPASAQNIPQKFPLLFPESENGDIRNSIGHKLRYIVGGRSLAQISPPPLPFFFFSGASPPHLRSESIPLLLLPLFPSLFPSPVPYNKHMCAA